MESTRHAVLAHTRALRGFTLIEMIVVLAIISVLTTVVLLGHADFDRTLLLTDTAYSAALSMREMQTYGLSSRNYSGFTNVGYGVHVSASTPTSYLLFADTSVGTGALAYCPTSNASLPDFKRGNCIYDSSGTPDGVVTTYALSRGFKIYNFCGKDYSNSAVRYCSSTGALQALDTVFLRGNTDTILSGQQTSAGSPWVHLSTAEIYFQTADGTASRGICISSVGQITVTTTTCP